MQNSLHILISEIAQAADEQTLRNQLMDGMGEIFSVQRWGIYLMQTSSDLPEVDVKGVSTAFVESYEKYGRQVDPVLNYVLTYHVPAHEEMVLAPGTWKQCDLYQNCCGYYNHEHIMTGPIVGSGELIGTIHFARVGDTPEFNSQDVFSLSALCLHVSACLAMLRQPQANNIFNLNNTNIYLTPREKEIITLVSKGHTNAEIAKALWIKEDSVKQALKRLFKKLQVRNRVELIDKCIFGVLNF